MNKIALSLLATVLATPLFAEKVSLPHVSLELLPGWRTEAGTQMAALHVQLEDGWKTYWRAPGEVGIPPKFDWSASGNVAAISLHWPVPEVITSNDMTTLGYHGDLVLPVEITPTDPGADIVLSGSIEMGICNDVCVPVEVQLSADLLQAETTADPRIEAALADQPQLADSAGLVTASCSVAPISDGLRVTAQLDLPPVGPEELMVFEPEDRTIWVSQAEQVRQGDRLTASADLVPPNAQPFELDTKTLRLTVISDGRAVDIQGCTRLP